MKKIYMVMALALISSIGRGQTQLAAWVFDATPAAPSTPASVVADLGTQAGTATLYANGTNGSSTWITATTGNELTAFGGNVLNDPRGTPVAGNSYCPVGGTGFSANGKSMVFVFSMTGYENPVLTFATRGTSTGFNTHQWAWSTDNVTYTNFGTNTAQTATSWVLRTEDMSAINSLDGASTVYLRVTFSGATNATGNNRLDNIVINATSAGTPSLSVSSASLAFGSQAVGTQSTSQNFNLSGSNLTGAPGDITVSAPSTEFQVSNDDATWGPTTTIAYSTATLSATPVYVRFTPQSAGAKSGNITFSGGGVTTPPTVALTGTGTATFYSNSTLTDNLTDLATWGTNTNGSGTAPADFTTAYQIFVIANRTAVTLNANWSVSGTSSKVVLGDGTNPITLTLPSAATINNASTNPIDISNNAVLEIANNIYRPTGSNVPYPYFGTIAANSIVNYSWNGTSATDTVRVPASTTFGNLTLTSGLKYFSSGTVTVAGNIVATGVAGMNGWYQSAFSTINLGGNFTLSSSAFDPNGAGDAARLTLALTGSGTQTLSGGDFYLFRLQTPATPITTLDIALGSATNLYLGNPSSGGLNLQQAAHTLSLNGNTLNIQQSGLFSTSNAGTITGSATSNVIVNKTSGTGNMGTVGFTAGSQVLNNFSYNSAGTGTNNLTLATPLTVNGTLTLTAGNIQLGANNLTVAGTVSGGSATSYVNTNGTGSLIRNGVTGATTFPIGNTKYNPLIIANADGYNWTTSVADGLTANAGFNTDKAVLLTWNITPSTDPTTSPTSVTFQYDEATQTGATYLNTEAVQAWHKPGTGWQMNGSPVVPGGVAGATTVTVPGLTFFSPFALANISGPLPVSYVNFSGFKQGTVNKLTWTTASEQNSRGFEVQRSADGINYTTIGFVNSQAVNGNSDVSLVYNFTDVNPTGNKQYYRLRQADVNGGSKFSNVIVIKGEKANALTIDGIYPNPASSQLNVAVSSPVRTSVTLLVVDMTGQVVARKVAMVAEGSNAVPVDVTALAGGSYTLRVVGTNLETVHAKFVKR